MIIKPLNSLKHILIDVAALLICAALLMVGAGIEFPNAAVILAVTELYLAVRNATRTFSENN